MGVRELVSSMMLQLDMDQECYDFIKWYETEGQRGDYDWGNMVLPFLNIKNANPFEDADFIGRSFGGPNNTSAVMLLKIKLLVDCNTIRLTRRVLAGKLPIELWRTVEQHVIRSPLSLKFEFPLMNSRELALVEDKLSEQIKRLSTALQCTNEHFVAGLLDPDDLLKSRPGYYSAGSTEEMMIALQYSFPAWWQHEGVLELPQAAKDIAAKDSDSEIDDMMKSSTFKQRPGSDRTRAEMLDDVSRNRLWGYIDWAIEDSRNLFEEKPSDRHIREINERWKRRGGDEDLDMDEDEDENDLLDVD